VDTEAIEQSFASAGWEIDRSFSEYLIIGYNGDSLSILAHPEAGEPEGPVFELIDHERNLTYGVQEIPTPSRPHRFSKGTASPRGVGRRPALRGDFAVLRSPGLPTSTYSCRLGRNSP
jgi:hypothetical protein